MQPVAFTLHAATRYTERANTALTPTAARTLLPHLAQTGTITTTPPEWATARTDQPTTWLHLGNDIAFPLAETGPAGPGLVALTCLTRTHIKPHERARRTQNRQQRQHQRRARAQNNTPHPDPPAPTPTEWEPQP